MPSLFSAKRRRPRLPRGVRAYAIGDVHGRADLLAQLHSRIDSDIAQNPVSRVIEIYLGDYIDRGPESRRVIDLLIARKRGRETVLLKGNHETYALQFLTDPKIFDVWRQVGGLQTLSSYGVELPARAHPIDCKQLAAAFSNVLPYAHVRFLSELAPSFTCGDFFFVHAGVRPGISLDRQKEDDLLWTRDEFLLFDGDFGKYVVHGHTPVQEPDVRANRLNIDTGAFATGRLACVAIEGENLQFIVVGQDGAGRSLTKDRDDQDDLFSRIDITFPYDVPSIAPEPPLGSTEPIVDGISIGAAAPSAADQTAESQTGEGGPSTARQSTAVQTAAHQITSREAFARRLRLGIARPIAAVTSALALMLVVSAATVSVFMSKHGTNAGGIGADELMPGPAINNFGSRGVDVNAEVEQRLIVQQELSASGNNDLQLGAAANVQSPGLVLELIGLPQGMTVSAGQPLGAVGWRVPAADAAGAVIHAPPGFAGTVDLVVELRRVDGTIADIGLLRREWKRNPVSAPGAAETPTTADSAPDKVAPLTSTEKTSANPPSKSETAATLAAGPQYDRAYIDLLVARSEKLMTEGDIGSARTLLQRAAEARDAHAALALGATFDPIMLAIVQARGITPDVSLARYWYEKASALGSAEAQQRLNSLTAKAAAPR
jgi:serine/threonine protein phosphatase 1